MQELFLELIFYFKVFESWLYSHWQNLKEFEFAYYNPLFWLFVLLTVMVLSRVWELRKAISYCSIMAAILLAATWIEGIIDMHLYAAGESFDVAIMKMVAFCMTTSVSVVYFFLV